jgi:THO complex subunit 2
VQLSIEKLTKELEFQERNHAQVIKRLERDKDTFLTANMAKKNQTILYFIQTCILPRCLYTASDALFCAKYALPLPSSLLLSPPLPSSLLSSSLLLYSVSSPTTLCLYSLTCYLRFVQVLVSLGTPYFSMLQYVDRILKDLPYALFACTENEATRIGRFLNETLALLARLLSLFSPFLSLFLSLSRPKSL